MFEQTCSESKQGRINTESRKKILQIQSELYEKEPHQEELDEKREKRTRSLGENPSKKIMEGSDDRLKAIPYDTEKYTNTRVQDQNAYKEGFFEHGNRELNGKLESLSEDQLKAIGYNDFISGVDAKKLPETIRNNSYYSEGYLLASIIEERPKPKHR